MGDLDDGGHTQSNHGHTQCLGVDGLAVIAHAAAGNQSRVAHLHRSAQSCPFTGGKSIDGDDDTGKNLYLFAENDNGTAARNCQSRFYWLKLHQDGNLSLSLHPARLKNGLVVLWDVKRNMAYPPRGQDGRIREFSAAGPEIPYTDVVKRGVKIIVR
jgi:hypothetical protein